ncbi:glycogen synthase kinase binding protein [Polypterus senegalus]
MPCRKENYIFLEQSVTVDSKEVDALVTKIGEALQLHNNATNGSSQRSVPCLHQHHCSGGGGAKQGSARAACCLRLRTRAVRSRASPYSIPADADSEWSSLRSWNRKKGEVMDDDGDPHQLLQELILSGNLIKEAVRRLQFSAAERVDHAKSSDHLQY